MLSFVPSIISLVQMCPPIMASFTPIEPNETLWYLDSAVETHMTWIYFCG